MFALSKKDSMFIKGVAICLMLIHHLFAFPERVPFNYVHIFSGVDIELIVGAFGKICVPIFLYISGYGFSKSGLKPMSYYYIKIQQVYLGYLFIFILFIPVALVFFSDNPRYNFSPVTFILNLFTLSSSYNLEWWFLDTYFLLVLFTPFLLKLKQSLFAFLFVIIFLFIGFAILRYLKLDSSYISIKDFLYWQLPFALGMLHNHFENKKNIFNIFFNFKVNTVVLSIAIITILYYYLATVGLILGTPFFVYILIYISRGGEEKLFTNLVNTQ